jgi:hypothetical protein
MQQKAEAPKIIKIEDSKLLPGALYLSTFFKTRVLYKGKLLAGRILPGPKNQALKAIEVGDYLYIEQEKYGQNTKWAALARSGHNILWIVHKPTWKTVGKVVNGEITKL